MDEKPKIGGYKVSLFSHLSNEEQKKTSKMFEHEGLWLSPVESDEILVLFHQHEPIAGIHYNPSMKNLISMVTTKKFLTHFHKLNRTPMHELLLHLRDRVTPNAKNYRACLLQPGKRFFLRMRKNGLGVIKESLGKYIIDFTSLKGKTKAENNWI